MDQEGVSQRAKHKKGTTVPQPLKKQVPLEGQDRFPVMSIRK